MRLANKQRNLMTNEPGAQIRATRESSEPEPPLYYTLPTIYHLLLPNRATQPLDIFPQHIRPMHAQISHIN